MSSLNSINTVKHKIKYFESLPNIPDKIVKELTNSIESMDSDEFKK